jgi:hypothetical protein
MILSKHNYIFNIFNHYTAKIAPKTTVRDIITGFLNKPDVITLWLSFNPHFSIISLLFNNNDKEGYINKEIESNLEKFKSIHDIPNFFKNLSSSLSSSSNLSSSSSSETVIEQVKRITTRT